MMKMPLKIGVVTVGQTPREDILGDVGDLWRGIEVLECGALDELTDVEVSSLQPSPLKAPIVTRLRTGHGVVVDKSFLMPRVQACFKRLAQKGVRVLVLLCTGYFPRPDVAIPVVLPEPLLLRSVSTLGIRRLGVLTPHLQQFPDQKARWMKAGISYVAVAAANPYAQDALLQVEQAAMLLKTFEVEAVVLDCLGYTREHKEVVNDLLEKPTILARTLLARFVAELC
jgi:protein AroM